ncbi:MAG: glycosyl hydrolase [Myxococcales bacterium]|nr:glycosyl hydrolase [Myxococcales bacterium]
MFALRSTPLAPPVRGLAGALVLAGVLAPVTVDAAEIQRTRFELPVANGHTALLVDLQQKRATQLREHLFAAEEPLLDAQGEEVWDGSQFAAAYTRDLLYDAYFGVRAPDSQFWLTSAPVDLDASGYVGWKDGERGGTGIVEMVQTSGDLEATSYFFTPKALEHVGFVMVMRVRNTGGQTLSGVQGFSIANFHLGFGRANAPWDVGMDIGDNGETLSWDPQSSEYVERGFAGVVVARPLAPVAHHASTPGADPWGIVDGGAKVDLPDNTPPMNAVDGTVGAYQFDLGDLAPGEAQWVGVAFARHADPFQEETASGWLDAAVGGKGAKAMVDAEIAAWADFQASVVVPDGASADEERLVRHSAAMLKMGQVQEETTYLREWLSQDGEVRRTRFPGPDNNPVELPATVKHHGKGAILASMPPGNWTYAWIRDGAYATVAMAVLGMKKESRDALSFYLEAEAGRFKDWSELAAYNMPDYQISLVRYYGFGVEETDFNDFGPNLEFDGFGLFLWALNAYERETGDESLSQTYWPVISGRIADVLVALIEPETGLIRPDSSIWETHWKGRERHFAYTSLTAARGLCDAADIAARFGDADKAALYAEKAEELRDAIAMNLTDDSGMIASTYEELVSGKGYYDAAVWDAVSMGLFDPAGTIAAGTMAGLDSHLQVAAGPGWSRNDDRFDHQNAEDLSPWGSDYDSAEWVITDLRGSIAARMIGANDRADALIDWVRDQALANYLMVAETFDENDGTYKFNTPMLGFGAGAYSLALVHRAGGFGADDPACGAYYDEGGGGTTTGGETTGGETTDSAGTTDAGTTAATTGDSGATTGSLTITDGVANSTNTEGAGLSAGTSGGDDPSGCACTTGEGDAPWAWLLLVAPFVGRGRRRRA